LNSGCLPHDGGHEKQAPVAARKSDRDKTSEND